MERIVTPNELFEILDGSRAAYISFGADGYLGTLERRHGGVGVVYRDHEAEEFYSLEPGMWIDVLYNSGITVRYRLVPEPEDIQEFPETIEELLERFDETEPEPSGMTETPDLEERYGNPETNEPYILDGPETQEGYRELPQPESSERYQIDAPAPVALLPAPSEE